MKNAFVNGLTKTAIDRIFYLTEIEKEDFFTSLNFLKFQMAGLTERFYYYLLKTNSLQLLKDTDMNKQRMMFTSTMGIIISQINTPSQFKQEMEKLATNHANYGLQDDNINDFIESFNKALNDIFTGPYKERFVEMWNKIIYSKMEYFRFKISLKND